MYLFALWGLRLVGEFGDTSTDSDSWNLGKFGWGGGQPRGYRFVELASHVDTPCCDLVDL
jgi:hypothetical protein